MRVAPLLSLLALASCGYAQDEFEADFIQALCDKYAECDLFDASFTEEQCREGTADTGTEATAACEYDKSAAKDCIEAWQELACPDVDAGETLSSPAACGLVCSGG